MPAFRFQAARGLLTYSRIGDMFTAHAFAVEVVTYLATLGTPAFQYRWAVERHKIGIDGNADVDDPYHNDNSCYHVHVCFDLGKQNTLSGPIFDYGGFHPNVKRTGGKKQWENQVRYLEKEGFFEGTISLSETRQENGENSWAEALSQSTQEDFHQVLCQKEPEKYLRSWSSINSYSNHRYQKTRTDYVSPYSLDDFNNTPHLLRVYADYINSEEIIDRPRALIIISDTRFGKTKWARAITPDHGYVRGEWNPDAIQDCKLLIFDDIPMEELLPRMRWKPFFGMQDGTFNITGKYRVSREVTRTWKGFIFLCNIDPREEQGVNESTARYITQNSHIITLDAPLFS